MAGSLDTDSSFWSSLERRVHAEWLALTLFTLLVTILLSLYSEQTSIARTDHTFYDSVLRAHPNTDVGEDIVIIAIDDGSIEQLGHWPWRRVIHAQLLERLSEARRVGFDIIFSEPNLAFPHDDALLAQAIARHGRVVLPTMVIEDPAGGSRLQSPLTALAVAATSMGYINVYPDSDGTVRSLTLLRETASGPPWEHFSIAMLGRPVSPTVRPEEKLLIPYAGPAGHFTFYSYAAVLRGDVPAAHFRDRLVLVGAWGSGLGDTFPTPMTRHGEAMSGVEILANGLHALDKDNWIRTLPPWLCALLSGLPVLLACLAFRRFSPRHSFLATLAIIVAWTALAITLLTAFKLWLPITASLIGIALAFPLWSWRSQEASLQHIDRELHSLQQATAWEPAGQHGGTTVYDRSLPARVKLLHQAIARFRHAQQKREETLRFLSHDMRAPQNAILALIEMQRREPEASDDQEVLTRIERRATDTLELMDGFVQLERAEVVSLGQHPIELGSLLLEACDACWEMAQRRHITLLTDDLPEEAWVEGDHKLLSRVLRNLLDNALKYSPDHTTVRCGISRAGDNWHLTIEDQGRGIPPEQIDRIFDPFIRVDADTPGNSGGAGLGLAFVRTTVQRHRGTISAHSLEGRGSVFTISLPALAE